MTEPNSVGDNMPGGQEVVNLTPGAKKDIATKALHTLGANDVDEKKEVATAALHTLGANAVDAKKEIATTALHTLGTNAVDAKKEIAATALQTLSLRDQEDIIGQVLGPSPKISDRIWQWVVGAFAIVFIAGSGALITSVFFLPVEQIQVLLTVFTTVAGILAGFISGRASASGSSRTTR
jgi:hypothetical protein